LAKIKAHSLTGRITEILMRTAFRNVKRNRGVSGIDKVSIKLYEQNLADNLLALMRRLKDGTFRPLPLRRVLIPKGDGKMRPLGIPAVRDRVAQEVLRLLLSPIFEPIFHDDSYGFRPARNCHMAVERVLELHRQGHSHVLDADIKGFFDNIPFHVIMSGVAAEVADGNILCLVERFLRAGVMEEGAFRPTTVGTPQGGVISPLLANITLNSLDWQLDDAGFRFVRYADDFVVLAKSQAQAQQAHDLVQSHLDGLGLTLSAEKTKLTKFRRLCLPGLRPQGPDGDDAPQGRGEVQDQDSRIDTSVSQPGCASHREGQRGGARHGELLRHRVLQLLEAVWRLGQMAADAYPQHEVQAQAGHGQLAALAAPLPQPGP
jgi:group II intron reverse transcriptase/maturase